jgi:gluconate 5-dehydrogenase
MQHSPLFDLTGRRALITGSSQGIGLALARGLAEHGASVVLNGRDATRLRAAEQALRADGFDVQALAFDVTNPEAARQGVERIEQEFGPIDILINNAGIMHRAALDQFPLDKWDEIIRTNVSGLFYVGQPVAQRMIARRRGRIINIASALSELARPGVAPYVTAKGAVRNLTRGMAADWARHGLQVNAIAPGYFRTPLNQPLADDPAFNDWLCRRTPAGRWGELPELVGAAVFLASDAASYVNGHTLYVDGGMTTSV